MSRARPASAAAALTTLALAAAGLAGCVSLLPKQKPAQLYRFGVAEGASSITSDDAAGRVSLIAPPVVVVPAAGTDQMLTITGRQAAFIDGARWISPAAVLWDDALRRAFADRSAHVRLLTRSEFAGGQAFLRTDVPEFEVRYPAPDATPVVHVALHALLAHKSGVFSSERTFAADVPAAENRVEPIVAAYDAAVGQVLAAAVTWADAHAEAAASEPASAAAPPSATRTTRTTNTTTSTPSASPL